MPKKGVEYPIDIFNNRADYQSAYYNNAYAMAALNTGWDARFQAKNTKDIKSVRLNWSSVSAPGQVTLRIETDASGKPSGTLYDANAVITGIVPASGVQTYTFATLPTTGLVVGDIYHIVLLTTTGGTTQTLTSYVTLQQPPNIPSILLTAADGTTRTNFAEVSSSAPIIEVIVEDDTIEEFGFCCVPTSTTFNIYGSRAAGGKFTINADISLIGFRVHNFGQIGAVASRGDLRGRILDLNNNLVSGCSVTVSRYAVAGGALCNFIFPSVLTLPAGDYRMVVDCNGGGDVSNYFVLRAGTFFSSAGAPAHPRFTTSTDGTTFSNSSTANFNGSLLADNLIIPQRFINEQYKFG